MARRRLLAAFCLLLACGAARAAAGGAAWHDYQVIEWQPANPRQLATLKRIGVTAGSVTPDRDPAQRRLPPELAGLNAARLRCYIENIATDFYSAYHRWFPDKPVNWRFLELQQRYRQDPASTAALLREPSLSDPAWLARVRRRIDAVIRNENACRPLFYNLGDETGIADLTAFWDFDLSPASLAGMRQWLRQQYGSLAALNAEWGTRYASWDRVQPELTRQAMRRSDGNYAAWSDFKAWMDVAFARALRAGAGAVHAADPHALAGIEGVQRPGWGGYDLGLLAHSVDLMEVSANADSLPMLHALDPRLVLLTTSFGADARGRFVIWRALLNGARGLVLWDPGNGIVRPDGALTPKGDAYAALFAELHRIGPRLIAAAPVTDPVAVLYSQQSFRLQWMLDRQPNGDAWMHRSAEDEVQNNAWRAALDGYIQALSALHLRPRIVTPAMLGSLHARVLLLPDMLSLSPQAAAAIRRFAGRGGLVIADRAPGGYDGHGRRMPMPMLAPGVARIVPPHDTAALARLLASAGIGPSIRIGHADGSDAGTVAAWLYRDTAGTILALQNSAPAAAAQNIAITLPRAAAVCDLRSGRPLGTVRRVTVTLDPVEATLLALAEHQGARPPHAPEHDARDRAEAVSGEPDRTHCPPPMSRASSRP